MVSVEFGEFLFKINEVSIKDSLFDLSGLGVSWETEEFDVLVFEVLWGAF